MNISRENQVKYIDSIATTAVKSGKGWLHAIVVGNGANGTIKVYDADNGTTNQVAELKANIVEGTYQFNVRLINGLTIVTAAASKITVIYE